MLLYKRKAVSDSENYRAINLTVQISKAVEWYLCSWFTPIWEERAFGHAQFAYRQRDVARDAVLYYVFFWIEGLNEGNTICIYCSDVSGAFDGVDSDPLMKKLESFGLNVKLIRVIRSWLRHRTGFVKVRGDKSEAMHLSYMVYQRTVWGPPLWNAFFRDCICSISRCGFEVVVYADDCNAFRFFHCQLANDAVLEHLAECQASLHAWGRATAWSLLQARTKQ